MRKRLATGESAIRHHTSEGETERNGRRVAVRGLASEALAPGGYNVRAFVDGRVSQRWQPVRILPGEVTRVSLNVVASAHLAGRVTRAGAPVASLGLTTQRIDPSTNLSWATTTDANGAFAFEPLLPGTYRVWASGWFVTNVTLGAGERSAFEWDIGGPSVRVELRARGLPATDVSHVYASALDGGGGLSHVLTGVAPGVFEGPLPAGPLFFELDATGLGPYSGFVAIGQPSSGAAHYVLDLAETGLELASRGPDLAAVGAAITVEPPFARLQEVAGRPLRSRWGTPMVLARRTVEGRTVWPHIPARALVELDGLEANAGRRRQFVRVEEGGLTRVEW